ncbi:MAG: hypothetical protein LAO07_21840 [Acidobacteriia bacterium]|nr:hypothetical protein [Terriglobia bacterium]
MPRSLFLAVLLVFASFAAMAGQVMWEAAGKHLPENTGAKAFDLILVELKGRHAPAKPATTK